MNQKVKMKPSYLKIAFLDRDGTLIKDYPDEKWREIKEPEFLEGSIEGLKRLKEMGYDFIIITNQYLINDGIISLNDYQQFTGKFLKKLKEENIEDHDMHTEHYYIKQEDVDKILKAFYLVYNTLGYGFLERVYQNALYFELIEQGFKCEVQKQINVFYKNHKVGEYYADMVINNSIILELKAADALRPEHEFQLINYLKATDIEIGYLLNFGKHPEFKRKIFSHH